MALSVSEVHLQTVNGKRHLEEGIAAVLMYDGPSGILKTDLTRKNHDDNEKRRQQRWY